MRERVERKIDAVDQLRHTVRSWIKAIVKEAIEEERAERPSEDAERVADSPNGPRNRLVTPLLLISGIVIGFLAAIRVAGRSDRDGYSTPGRRSDAATDREDVSEGGPEPATDPA